MKIDIKDPRIGKYYVAIHRGLHLPVKIIKRVGERYLCTYYRSAFPLINYLYKSCGCTYKYKCVKNNLICFEEKNLIKELDPERGKILVGK